MGVGEGFDRAVLDWFVGHREPWLDTVMKVVTVLGGSVLLVPLVVAVGTWYWRRLGTSRPFTLLAVTYAGSHLLSQSIKALVGRPRPPAELIIGDYSGFAFPSGHATQAAAVWLMLAVVLAAGLPAGHKVWIWVAATLTVVVVGITRLYLAAHWLTDVFGGWALGSLWFLIVLAASQAVGGRRDCPRPVQGSRRATPHPRPGPHR